MIILENSHVMQFEIGFTHKFDLNMEKLNLLEVRKITVHCSCLLFFGKCPDENDSKEILHGLPWDMGKCSTRDENIT